MASSLVAMDANRGRADNCGETALFGERTVTMVFSTCWKMESAGWRRPLEREGRRAAVVEVELGTRLPTTVSRCGAIREDDPRHLLGAAADFRTGSKKGVHPVR